MKAFAAALAVVLCSCATAPPLPPPPPPPAALEANAPDSIAWPAGLPVYDHVVIVVEENKDFEQIIDNPDASYINGTLRKEGANLTRMFAEEHHSEGNYFWLFSGSNQGVGFIDTIPSKLFTTANLGKQLIDAHRSFKGYSEDLPTVGSTVHRSGHYARKHVPWISFSNVPPGSNLRFKDFPAGFGDLPTISFVIPNLINDMHDGAPSVSIKAGDTWLRKNLDDYYQWAKKNNSLLIFTFDENDDGTNGLTDPAASAPKKRNRIATILAGARIKPGDYDEGKGVTHVNVLRTLEAMYGLKKAGAQQPFALHAGIPDDLIITDAFEAVP
jgi:acid phosphatase